MRAIDRDLDHRAAQARRVLACLDLARLDENDAIARMLALVDSAFMPYGEPAVLCVYSEFVNVARARPDERERNWDSHRSSHCFRRKLAAPQESSAPNLGTPSDLN